MTSCPTRLLSRRIGLFFGREVRPAIAGMGGGVDLREEKIPGFDPRSGLCFCWAEGGFKNTKLFAITGKMVPLQPKSTAISSISGVDGAKPTMQQEFARFFLIKSLKNCRKTHNRLRAQGIPIHRPSVLTFERRRQGMKDFGREFGFSSWRISSLMGMV